MPGMETVGRRLQHVRNQKGLTLEQLADQAGISKSFLWEVEHDRSGITGHRLLRVADALGASLDFLLRGEPAPLAYEPPTVEIPHELSEVAEELGLTYRQTLAMLDIERSILARRSSKTRERKSRAQWHTLYEGVKEFLEDGR